MSVITVTGEDVKISELEPASAVSDTDQIELNQSGTTRSGTLGQVIARATTVSQPLDPTLTALAALDPTTGLLEQTGPDTFVKRDPSTIMTQDNADTRYVNVTGDTMTGALVSQGILPSADKTYALGTATNRYTNVFAQNFYASDNAGVNRAYNFRTGSLMRWTIYANTTAEGGSNAGSNFAIGRYDDAGAFIGNSLVITRSSGTATLSGTLTPGATQTYALGATTAIWTFGFFGEVRLDNAAATNRTLRWNTAGVSRFSLYVNATAESGSNAGSDMRLTRYDDAGTNLGDVFGIQRSSGIVTFNNSPLVPNITYPDGSGTTKAANTKYVADAIAAAGGGATNEQIDDRVAALLQAGANVTLTYDDVANTLTISSSGGGAGGSGTVTTLSVVSANGLAGAVANPTTTPAITLSTTVAGLLKGSGGAISAATPGADYMTPANVSATYAPLASPTFTGDPQAPTPATADNDTSIATTAFVKAQGYAVAANYLPLAGGTLTGTLTARDIVPSATNTYTLGNAANTYLGMWAQDVTLNDAAGTDRNVDFRTAGSLRWRIQTTATAEGGSNAGSNFLIQACTDAGAANVNALSIARATGIVTIPLMANGTIFREGAGSGITAGTAFNNLVIDSDGSLGMTFASPNTITPRIAFADPESPNAGYIDYIHSTDTMSFGTNGAVRTTISSAGSIGTTGAIKGYNATGIPAGGITGLGYSATSATNFGLFFGSGAPTLSAARGSIYLRSDGQPYFNTNGTTGWEALATASGYLPLTGGNLTGPLGVNGSTASATQPFNVNLVADDNMALFYGVSKGVRIKTTGGATFIEGVDNTGVGSFQPLVINGSETHAKTPAAASNSTEIATTAWVRANSINVPLLGDFCAVVSAAFTLGTSNQTLTPTTIISGNSGGWYNSSTGVYTPPAGRYLIKTALWGANAAAVQLSLWVRKNGISILPASYNQVNFGGGAAQQIQATCDLMIDANGTDTFDVRCVSSVAASSVVGIFTAIPVQSSVAANVARIAVGTTAPASPAVNDLWVDTN